jgi:hypothetical protein
MRRHLVTCAAVLALACSERPAPPETSTQPSSPEPARAATAVTLGALEELPLPAIAGAAGEPFLVSAPDGTILLTWIERAGDRATVKLSRFDGKSWAAPSTIVEGDDLFVNWADFPSVHPLGNERLAAHWLQRSGSGKYAYDVRLAQSADGGTTWSAPITPHKDGTPTEHGFVSLASAEGSAELQAIWLDGRNMVPEGGGHGGGDMSLRWGRFAADGATLEEKELDARTCECCQTAMTMTPQGAVVAYRDRSETEVRDIAVVRQTAAGWSPPSIVHADGWKIPGCPVNGPQLASSGARVALAWFTVPKEEGFVNVAFSDDGGGSWSTPVRVDQGNPIGRVDIVMPSADTAVVAWLERAGEASEVRARVVTRQGAAGGPLVVGRSSSDRAAGFPRITTSGNHIYFVWTEPGEPSRLRISRVKVNS